MTVDMFSTRTMLAMLEVIFPVKTFLLDTFFRSVEQSLTEKIDIDIVKGQRRLAPFVRHSSKAKQVERIGYETKTFEPPYIKMKMSTNAGDALKRQPGINIYQNNGSVADMANQLLAKDLMGLQDMVVRREEWMASQLLETGKIVVSGDDYDAEIDFGMAASHKITLTGTDLWTDANSTPLDDLREWFDKIGEDCGLNPDVVVMGRSVANAFTRHNDVKQMLDNRRIEMGQIDPRLLPNGAIFLGTLKDPAVDVYRYNEYYYDEGTSSTKPMVPVDKLFMGSTQARTARHYSLIKDLQAGNAAVRFFPKSWEEQDPSIRWLLVQSGALVCMHQPDGFLVAKAV